MSTKSLAKKLGLIHKCNLKLKNSKEEPYTSRERVNDKKFDYLLVLDFESTCWEKKSMQVTQEIIEFPVVLLDVYTGKILDEFHQYVFPVEHPTLSEFCIQFTGIQQSQVDDGVPLPTAIALFASWLRDLSKKFKFSLNANVEGKHAAFVTWSDWDLGLCLHYECLRKQLKKPDYFNRWIDIRLLYKRFYSRNPEGLAGALQDLGMKFEGREHSGIVDARNTAALVSRMIRDGCNLEITKTIETKSYYLVKKK